MRIIALPRHSDLPSRLTATQTSTAPKDRKAAMDLLRAANAKRSADVIKTLTKLTNATGPSLATRAKPSRASSKTSKSPKATATGAFIVDGDQETLQEMKATMHDYDVIGDFPISLIPPTRNSRSSRAKLSISDLDLWHLSAVRLAEAKSVGLSTKGENITVAVLDTGIAEVQEIKGKVKRAFARTADQTDWKKVKTYDTDGHGTHVAGLICGTNVGVAPAAEVVNIIMIPKGIGNFSDFILALDWVAEQADIAIMNMSAGIEGYRPELKRSIDRLRAVGVLPIIAVGNEGRNTSRSPGNFANVLTVGASTPKGKVASFSGGGQIVVDNLTYSIPDIVAPGDSVMSCVMSGSYEAWSGSSMATPIVSGIAALICSKHPDISVADLEGEILAACRSLGEAPQRQGEGLAQIPKSLWS